MMTLQRLKETMKAMVDRPNSLYPDPDKYPYNCCYYDGVYLMADCNNLIKSICWSDGECAYNYTVGKFYYSPNATMGDWTGRQILDHCYNVSTDMTHIDDGEFMYWENESGEWHCGLYYGEDENGQRLVFEATPAFENGILFTTIDANGVRPFDGESEKKWSYHGKLWWVEYPKKDEIVTQTPTQTQSGQNIIIQNVQPSKELTETVDKPTLMDSLINLLKIKSLITLSLTAVVVVRAIQGDMDIEQIYLMVIAFYFGTQSVKGDNK